GAKKPNHPSASTPLTPSSANVGTSGTAVERFLPELARIFTLPARCCSVRSAIASTAVGTFPPISSFMYAAEPLYGTCNISMPAWRLSSTPKKWGRLPAPDVAYDDRPGLALAHATYSGHVFAPDCGPAAIANWNVD